MRIIEITALSNGAHRNQTSSTLQSIPAGWAVAPDSLKTENFPFGEVTVETINGIPTVTGWTPGVKPEPAEPALPPAEQREEAYNTEAIIAWDSEQITVTAAAQLWQYYAAEGNEKAGELTALIAEAKQTIREKYPDAE